MNVLKFETPGAWARGVAAFWRDRLHTQPDLTICLPTGLTPNPVYDEMAKSVAAGTASFARATVFALDEFGGVAADDPGRTENMLMRNLIAHTDLPRANFHVLRLDGSDVDRECREYDAASGARFDLVLLGIGLNGHLGMNEPGSSAESPTRRVDLHESTIAASARYFEHANLPRWGVTVGMGPILASAEVWILASGPAKAEIVQRTLTGPVTEEVPSSLLRRHPNCSLFVDGESGARLG